MMRLIAAITMSTACWAASLALPSVGRAAFPGRNGALIFAETVNDRLAPPVLTWRIVSQGRPVSLASCTLDSPTDCPLYDPAFSPDGQQIAYVAAHADVAGVRRNGLFVAQADGSNPREVPLGELAPAFVTGAEVIAEQPAWSPDGLQLAFTASLVQPGYPQRFDTRLAEINIDGSYPRRGFCKGSQPAWSVVARQRGANIPISLLAYTDRGNVWIARAADCGRPRQVTQHGGSQPTWAPDAKRLAFVHHRDGHPALPPSPLLLAVVDHEREPVGKRHRRIRARSATGQVAGAATETAGLEAHRPKRPAQPAFSQKAPRPSQPNLSSPPDITGPRQNSFMPRI